MAGCLAQRYLAARGRRGAHIRSLTEAVAMREVMGACGREMLTNFAIGQLGSRCQLTALGCDLCVGDVSTLRSQAIRWLFCQPLSYAVLCHMILI